MGSLQNEDNLAVAPGAPEKDERTRYTPKALGSALLLILFAAAYATLERPNGT